MSSKSIILHIGTHKTGTTAIQSVLGTLYKELLSIKTRFYSGIYLPDNHVELHLAAMRSNRATPYKLKSQVVVDTSYRRAIAAYVRSFVELCPARQIIFSAEGLSYLRFGDEIGWLQSLFQGDRVRVVAYLRDKDDFLRSYRTMLTRNRLSFGSDPEAFNYVEHDTWLIDYDALLEAYRTGFGSEAVTVMNYDAEIAKHGGTVRSFLALLGFDGEQRRKIGEPRLNVSPSI